MRFLVDAHLPYGICAILKSSGHDAIHTRQLPAQNKTTDQVINDLSVRDQRVVISKDDDFYYSHLLSQKRHKLLLIRTGNIRTCELKTLIETHLIEIVQALEANSLVELDRSEVRIVI